MSILPCVLALLAVGIGQTSGQPGRTSRRIGPLLNAGTWRNPTLDSEWMEFMLTHRKKFGKNEAATRRGNWEKNRSFIKRHNAGAQKGRHTFRLKMNKFGDMSVEEFRIKKTGFRPAVVNKPFKSPVRTNTRIKSSIRRMPRAVRSLPPSVDWRNKGYVTPVKDQKECGACWAFAATGALESQWAKQGKPLVSLSEQNLLDCVSGQYVYGCAGGIMFPAWDYIKNNGGIDTEYSYPYENKKGTCRYNSQHSSANCSDWSWIASPRSETTLQTAVTDVGPVAVAVHATLITFVFYESGVYNDIECGPNVDHAVVVVGYNTSTFGGDYWIVKNSWGPNWGEGGYIKIGRNQDNLCGIADYAMYPLV